MLRSRALSAAWVGAAAAAFVGLQVVLLRWLPVAGGVASLPYVILIEFFALGVSYDAVTALLGMVVRERPVPRRPTPGSSAVALVCTTCDDEDPETFRTLKAQEYPNLEVFVLDDSAVPASRTAIDACGLRVVRRDSRQGYKAGNLNHWLRLHGGRFEYVVVADADSRLPPGFVTEMVCYAEHPENADVAIFESLLGAWNAAENRFTALQDALTPIRHRLAMGLLNGSGAMLSAGHNNLLRVQALQEVGGFTEAYLAEDYATTVEVVRRGWQCITVPVASAERVPAHVADYARREARWAYQTFQLGALRTRGVGAAAALRLAMSLHHYARPVALLAAFALITLTSLVAIADGTSREFVPPPSQLAPALALVAIPIAAQLAAGIAAGVRVSTQAAAMLMHQALAVACAGPVCRRLMTAALMGDRLGFNRTGRTARSDLRSLASTCAGGVACAWMALVVSVPAFAQAGIALQLLWLLPAAAAPFVLTTLQSTSPR